MPNKKFLEEYPLYRKFNLKIKDTFIRNLPKPAIHMFCKNCNSKQTFNMVNDYFETDYSPTSYTDENIFRLKYVCTACHEYLRFFFIKTQVKLTKKDDEETDCIYAIKVGQFPSWDINSDKNFTKFLGNYEIYYKKGLICESQSYGIASYAYYRKIVEGIIDELLKTIADFLEGADKKEYKKALKKVSETKVAKKKIELVKEMLPPSLCPDNLNPLAILHKSLSHGLHGKNDDECMEQAEVIRSVLIYLVNEVIRKKTSMKKFTIGMRKLLK
ncbi:MAG: hypothetical protein ABIA91_01610 [Patescibacteria group bacterium]